MLLRGVTRVSVGSFDLDKDTMYMDVYVCIRSYYGDEDYNR